MWTWAQARKYGYNNKNNNNKSVNCQFVCLKQQQKQPFHAIQAINKRIKCNLIITNSMWNVQISRKKRQSNSNYELKIEKNRKEKFHTQCIILISTSKKFWVCLSHVQNKNLRGLHMCPRTRYDILIYTSKQLLLLVRTHTHTHAREHDFSVKQM